MLSKIFKRMFIFVALCTFSFNLHAADWTMASGYPKSNFLTQNIIKFIDEVKSTTSVNINLNPNDTLIKLDAIKTSLQRGQIPIGEIRLGIYGNEDPMYILSWIYLLLHQIILVHGLLKDVQMDYLQDKFAKERFNDTLYIAMARTRLLHKVPCK